MTEIWKGVDGFAGRYEVSNLGNVRRLPFHDRNGRFFNGMTLRASANKSLGYRMLTTQVDGKVRVLYVHRLVAQAFVPNPEGKRFVNHIDGDKANCSATNLEWVTAKENTRHAITNGLTQVPKILPGERCRAAKLTATQVADIRLRLAAGETQGSIAKRYGVVSGTIGHIKSGATWAKGGGADE